MKYYFNISVFYLHEILDCKLDTVTNNMRWKGLYKSTPKIPSAEIILAIMEK